VPIYEYRCTACGPFEARRDHTRAGEPGTCPSCGTAAPRAFAAPFVRSPAGPFASVSREVRARVERSHTGEPVRSEGALPAGRRFDEVMHGMRHAHHRHAPRQPWLIGQ